MPTLGCRLPIIGRIKTTMSADKTTMSDKKVVSFEEASREQDQKEPMFSTQN